MIKTEKLPGIMGARGGGLPGVAPQIREGIQQLEQLPRRVTKRR